MIPIQDTIPTQRVPLVNRLIIVLNAIVFLLELTLDETELNKFFYYLGLVPASYTHPQWAAETGIPDNQYMNFITMMFLHGGWMHFIGNMWTLWIFGDNIEDRMGPRKYLVFYLICGIGAGLAHMYLYSDSTVPALGASGAISGIMAAYMFLFPKSRIVFLFPLFFIPYFFELPAFIYIGFWFFSQLFSGTFNLLLDSETAGIAFWAHIGGFITGVLLYKLFLTNRYRNYYEDEYNKDFSGF